MTSRRTLLSVLALSGPLSLSAGAGEEGFQFLALGMGVRQVAMGQAATAAADDGNGAFWNPAAWGELRRNEVSLEHLSHVASMSYEGLSLGRPLLHKGGVGLHLHRFDYGDIQGYGPTGSRTGGVDAGATVVALGYGRPLGRSWIAGVNLKHYQEAIGSADGQAFGGDVGVLHILAGDGWLSRLRFGGSVRNLGTGASFISEKTPLPLSWSLGASHQAFSEALTTALDISKSRDKSLSLRLGQELWINGTMALRAGLQRKNNFATGVTLGMGFRFQDLQIDYAFLINDERADQTHRVGLTYRFGGVGESFYREGVSLFQKGAYAEAVMKFKQVLDVHPRHPRAVARIKEAIQLLKNEDEGIGR